MSSENFRLSVAHIYQLCGLGRLRPNIVLIGLKTNWLSLTIDKIQEIDDYVGIIRDAFENNYGVLILRNGNDGFDLSEKLLYYNINDVNKIRFSTTKTTKIYNKKDNFYFIFIN